MAVTGTETVAAIIEDALLEIEAHTMGQTVTARQSTHALRILERMLKGWQQEHGTPAFLLASQSVTLTTATSYTLSPVRPMRLISVNYKDTNGIEIPMIEMTRREYDDLTDKTITGIPTNWYYDRQKESALLYIYPSMATATTETLQITYERESEDIAATTDVIDLPAEWYEAAVIGLAARLVPAYGREATKGYLRQDAKGALRRALGAGVDGTSVYWVAGDA